ncbi:hypothetical protein Taro_045057 [Colocasia esculenta]|uniref:Uncharacterized protein n=1 Tax=Colocasia esculenta TaxID=4460 RepID=A0A843WKZ1_COLES|nr:hypothetical protein [Colocasia esculenta]
MDWEAGEGRVVVAGGRGGLGDSVEVGEVDMSLRIGSRVQRLRTVDGVPGHPSQALLPITQGASSTASASSVAETPSWGRGTDRRGPARGATERRLEPGHK